MEIKDLARKEEFMRELVLGGEPVACKDFDLKFVLIIDGKQVEVNRALMAVLALNQYGELNHFLAGFFNEYPSGKEKNNGW